MAGRERLVAVVGSGPAGLVAADVIAAAPKSGGASDAVSVIVIEKRRSPARKILIAGSSGLNVSNDLPLAPFKSHYSGASDCWSTALERFPPQAWLAYIREIGHETFLGTSGRYFLREMKAGPFVRSWKRRIERHAVSWRFGSECTGVERCADGRWALQLRSADAAQASELVCDAVVFALGGGSYEPDEKPLRWPAFFLRHGLKFEEFRPSNVGYKISWNPAFLKECEGQPLKNISLTSSRGTRLGELVVTSYGVEGTPVYFVGEPGTVWMDLKPDLSLEQILARCRQGKENIAPIRRVDKLLKLGRTAHALLFHYAAKEVRDDMEQLARLIKRFPLKLEEAQSLDEAISAAGGLCASELDEHFMITKMPGVFAAGEMLNWDAPTGGFLLQACAAQGFAAGHGVLSWLAARPPSV